MEHASRRMIHVNATAHPSAAWTLQQLREAIASDHAYRFSSSTTANAIFCSKFDASVTVLGLEVIKTPVRRPKANARCERLIGTLRRECLDWMVPLTEGHLQKNSAILVNALQPRLATLLVGAKPARATARFPRVYATPSA